MASLTGTSHDFSFAYKAAYGFAIAIHNDTLSVWFSYNLKVRVGIKLDRPWHSLSQSAATTTLVAMSILLPHLLSVRSCCIEAHKSCYMSVTQACIGGMIKLTN